MSRRYPVISAILLVGLSVCAAAEAACELPQGLLPRGESTNGEARPVISWRAISGASAYRVKVLSRIPNGRVVGSYDTVVKSPSFLPPRPLAEDRAKVIVRVSAICGAEASAETVASFDIDVTRACRLGEMHAKRQGDRVMLEWRAVPGAKTYELRANALGDGRLIASGETRRAEGALASKAAAVVSVRPQCESGPGEAVYRVVAAD